MYCQIICYNQNYTKKRDKHSHEKARTYTEENKNNTISFAQKDSTYYCCVDTLRGIYHHNLQRQNNPLNTNGM